MKEIFREATLRGLFASSFGFFQEQMKLQYSGWERFANWVDMLWCVARHGSSPAEYAHLNFDKKATGSGHGILPCSASSVSLKKPIPATR